MSEFAGFRPVPRAGPRNPPQNVLTASLAFLVVVGLIPEALAGNVTTGTTEADIVLEIVKTIGIIVSAVAAVICATRAAEVRRISQRTENKVDRKRERVRRVDHEDGAKVVIEEGDRKRRDNDE